MDVRVPANVNEAQDGPAVQQGTEVVGRETGAKRFLTTCACMEGRKGKTVTSRHNGAWALRQAH